jgi:hypothetical protein
MLGGTRSPQNTPGEWKIRKGFVTVWTILLPTRRFTINHLGMNHSPARRDLPELQNAVSTKKNGRFRARHLATLLSIGLRRE